MPRFGSNNMAITKDNIIYLTNTSNSSINKIDNYNNIKIAGSDKYKGIQDGIGNQALFYEPRNIILTNNEKELYLLDDNLIRNVKLTSDSISGSSIQVINDVNINNNIFQNGGYGISKTSNPSEISIIDNNKLYIINTHNLNIQHKIIDNTINFIDVEYYNSSFYFISETKIYKCDDINTNITLNEININISIDELYGITFNKNNNKIILTCKINNNHKIISGYVSSTNNYIIDEIKNSKYNIKTLMDYNIIYDNDTNQYFIGKSSNTDKIYYISYESLTIDDENPNVISFAEQHEIYDYKNGNEHRILVETRNIIYSNKYKQSRLSNQLLYFNEDEKKILFLDYISSLYKTITLNFDKKFDYINDITINSDDTTIYLTQDYNIYYFILNTSNIQELYQSSNIIHNILYKNNKLYFITDKLYCVDNEYLTDSNIFNNNIDSYDNIVTGVDNESFENLTDFTIDTNNEVGYLAFDTKIKWFYIK